jgi:hypothetical protein
MEPSNISKRESFLFPDQKKIPSSALSNVLKNVTKLTDSHSPKNCSKNMKAICSDIQQEIDLNKVQEKKFDLELSKQYEKLNLKISDLSLSVIFSAYQSPKSPRSHMNREVNRSCASNYIQRIKLPSLTPTNRTQKPYRTEKKSCGILNKIYDIDNIVEKCNSLNRDIQDTKAMSYNIALSHKLIEKSIEQSRKKKKIEDKFNKRINSYVKFNKNEALKTSNGLKPVRKAWKLNHIKFISRLIEDLSLKNQ